mmetsp:Transcript_20746/g.51828  ORF Transcript_20746/g.51828 Transcript_20746/m.51828 type:complete len:89 (-) Transcript_20746:709-975(-)
MRSYLTGLLRLEGMADAQRLPRGITDGENADRRLCGMRMSAARSLRLLLRPCASLRIEWVCCCYSAAKSSAELPSTDQLDSRPSELEV